MAGKIYLLSEDSDLMAMEEAPYDTEKLLQEMLAKHPDLLAGDQINSDDFYRCQPSILKNRSASLRSGLVESGMNQTSNRAA